jgi:hypothetical protein
MSETKYAPETGLPALPEDLFWSVLESNYGGAYVELRRKRLGTRAFSKRLGRAPVYEQRDSGWSPCLTAMPVERLTAEDIRRAAERILERRERVARGRALLGDYPPKRLEAP